MRLMNVVMFLVYCSWFKRPRERMNAKGDEDPLTDWLPLSKCPLCTLVGNSLL